MWRLLILFVGLFSSIFANCPSGYTANPNTKKCYNFFSTPSSYFAAQYRCTQDGAMLASISNQFENQFVSSLITTAGSSWIGLTDQLNNFGQWQWLDGTFTYFFNWGVGQPKQGNKCSATRKNDTNWEAQDCSAQLSFVCNYDPAASIQQPTTACPTVPPVVCSTPTPKICPVRCDEGWTYYSKTNSCYRTYFGKTWQNAEELCVSFGGHLASIHSSDENIFIINLSKMGESTNEEGEVFIGGSRTCAHCDVTWSDGTPFDWNNWGPQEPYYTSNLCLQVCSDEQKGKRGEWENLCGMTSCSYNMRASVCQKRAYS